MTKDYYSILGVNRDVDEKTLKKAYRKLSKKYHPDINKDNPKAEEKFKDIAEAYDVLSNPQKKQNYDTFGSAEGNSNPFGSGFDVNDIFSSFFVVQTKTLLGVEKIDNKKVTILELMLN